MPFSNLSMIWSHWEADLLWSLIVKIPQLAWVSSKALGRVHQHSVHSIICEINKIKLFKKSELLPDASHCQTCPHVKWYWNDCRDVEDPVEEADRTFSLCLVGHVCDVHSHYQAYLFPAILDRNDFQEYFCHPLYQLTQCPEKNYKTRWYVDVPKYECSAG